MHIENIVYQIQPGPGGSWLQRIAKPFASALGTRCYPLRFALVEVSESVVVIEAAVVHFEPNDRFADALSTIEFLTPRTQTLASLPFTAVQIVPTGVRCEFGGFAGDAGPVTNLLAAGVDLLVTHPNAVNASELLEIAPNVLYVEGKALDDFLLGHIGLAQTRSNRIGTFVDPTGKEYLDHVVNALSAAIAVKGIACESYHLLPEELGVRIAWSSRGCAVGTVTRPEVMLDAVGQLISDGAQAIGGVSVIHGVTKEMFTKHLQGEMPNPSGGVEAILTHLISKIFRIPAAHAPLPYHQEMKGRSVANPRAAAEFISTPHYYCVLKGLATAPRPVPILHWDRVPASLITLNNVGAVVMPASCLGGIPALVAEYSHIPLIAVRENATVLNVTNAMMHMKNVIEVESYLEAAGVLLALRQGLSLASLRRPLQGPRPIAGGARAVSPHPSH